MTFTGIITVIKGFVSAVSKAFTYFNNKLLKKAGADEAELKYIKAENEKVNAAIDAGNDPKRVHLKNDSQNRANKRKG